jgi:hypothetical protein
MENPMKTYTWDEIIARPGLYTTGNDFIFMSEKKWIYFVMEDDSIHFALKGLWDDREFTELVDYKLGETNDT